jgi:serine/threonine protein kinase
MAIEVVTGRLVVVAICAPGRLSTLEPARDVRHRHLASLVDVVREVPADVLPSTVGMPAGAGAAVAEHVPGRTLRAVLESGPLHPAKAVAWALRVLDAAHVLHSSGAVHGAISPRSIIAEPRGRAIAPVLSQLIAPPIGAFSPPERLRGAPESPSDDVWALLAILYTALTGLPPYQATSRELLLRAMLSRPEPLSASGIRDPVLEEIILRGLMPDRRSRGVDLV